ncbi:hypothetical protein HK102_001269 [Quaeritorhiza haematococci]|nr:hypothetical protein HK102_001269 [Quaeritorhiza haematococci]
MLLLTHLPTDILHTILQFLPTLHDLAHVTSTCKALLSFYNEDIWAACILTKYGRDNVFNEPQIRIAIQSYMRELNRMRGSRWGGGERGVTGIGGGGWRKGMHTGRVLGQLVKKGGNAKGCVGDLLKYALETGEVGLVWLLVERSVATKEEALFTAALFGNVELTRSLVERGANVNASHDQRLKATMVGILVILETNTWQSNGSLVEASGGRALTNAVYKGHLEVARLLLGCGADVHANEDEAIRVAMSSLDPNLRDRRIEVVRLLLENGADVHVNDEMPLKWAAADGYLEIVQMLLEYGADIHAANEEPFLSAVRNRQMEVAKFLADRGADVHVHNDTALIEAVHSENPKMVGFLLDLGADVHVHNDEAVRAALVNGDFAITKLLLDRGAHIPDEGVRDAVDMDFVHWGVGRVEFLLDHGIGTDVYSSINRQPPWQETFVQAAGAGHMEMLELLFERGHDDVHTNNDEALRWAAGNGHLDAVKFLVDRGGADVLANGDEVVRKASANGHMAVVRFLLERGVHNHVKEG